MKEAVSKKTAAILVEPIQGEGGVYPATKEYLEGLRELCDKEGILLIFDEIQTGIGRTGELFAYQKYGVEPDIFTLAKALGNGVPVSAFLAKDEVAKAFNPGEHGSTFGGNSLACRAAYETVSKLLDDDLLSHVKEIGDYFKEELAALKEKYDLVTDLRGKGLMLGLELKKGAKEVVKKLLERNILILTAGENVLRFLPPLIITKEEVDKLIKELNKILSN